MRVVVDPPPDSPYTQVLRGPVFSPVRSMVGITAALLGYLLVVPLFVQLVLSLTWVVRGRPSGFRAYYDQAMSYHLPEGLVAGHLALALLIPLSLAVVRWVHWQRVRWLPSVQPGMRWRYLLLALAVAAVVLNAVLWTFRIGTPTAWNPQPHWVWWILLVLLTAPLQAAGEEFFFRGYLMQALGSLVPNQWFGVVTSALVFALFHGLQNVPLFLDRFGFGLLAGVLVLRTGGLEAGIAAHVINNVFAFGYAALAGGVWTARGVTSIGWAMAAQDLVGFALYAAAAWWLGRRLRLATLTPSV